MAAAKNIGCQFCDPETEIGKVTEFHKKKSKRLNVIEEKLMANRVKLIQSVIKSIQSAIKKIQINLVSFSLIFT